MIPPLAPIAICRQSSAFAHAICDWSVAERNKAAISIGGIGQWQYDDKHLHEKGLMTVPIDKNGKTKLDLQNLRGRKISAEVVAVQKYSVVYGRLIRAKLTPEMPSGNGLSHRGGAATLPELYQKIDRSYIIEGGAAV